MPTISEALNHAIALHNRGELDQAEQIYQQVREADARNADAWHLSGLVALARGAHERAEEFIGRAISLDSGQAKFHNHLAEVFRAANRLADAEQSCHRALALTDNYPIGHNTLGAVYSDQARWAEAAASYRRAVELAPEFALAHFNLGMALEKLDRLADAAASYERALGCDPAFANAHFRLAIVLQNPLSPIHNSDAAIACYRHYLALRPSDAAAHNNLGTLLKARGDLAEALTAYSHALEYRPDFAEALNNLGNLLKLEGRHVEAQVCYEQALRQIPDDPQARYNRGLMRLAAGDFTAGWPDYEFRQQCPGFISRQLSEPRWTGEKLGDRALLIHAEQGLGDTLQFMRYIPLVAARVSKIIVEIQPGLLPILRASGYESLAQLVPAGEPLPPFDVQIPMLSLPAVLGTTVETIPYAEGYLVADPELLERWEAVLTGNSYKIGIAWQGSRRYATDRWRSIPLAAYAPLALPGVELISLQLGYGVEQLDQIADQFPVRTLGDEFDRAHGAFMDTAAVMQQLDLVVTSDSAIAHVAGALSIPTWVALPLAADWRWLRNRSDSPWYRSLRLFRQSALNDWKSVFQQMAERLSRG